MTPFQAFYGYAHPHFSNTADFYLASPLVEMFLTEREETNKTIRQQLLKALSRPTQYTEKHQSGRSFEVQD